MLDLDDDSFITMTDENGNEVDFLLLDVMNYEGEDYLVLMPLSDEEEDGEEELFFLHAEKTEEGEVYSSVEDEALLQAISATYEKEFLAKMQEQEATSPDEGE